MAANKLKSYDKATQKLMLQAMELDVADDGRFSLPDMVFLLRETFKQRITYRHVFGEILREPQRDPSTGFCIVSSYYIYERTGGDAVWKIMHNPAHWWLVHRQTGAVFDVTYTQFSGAFPYHTGVEETRIKSDPDFVNMLRDKAYILGRDAGME